MPVSSSSSFSRQQRAQPSHRLSHSALESCSKVLVFQKELAWSDGFSGGLVIGSIYGFLNRHARLYPGHDKDES
ncbi:hypothetical protein GCM10022626_29070 [[Pseudomonas] carboxydohydrogena]